MRFRYMLQMDRSWKHTWWTKPDTERQILYNSTYMKYLKKATS